MGCDIHFFIERRKAGKWEYVPEPESAKDYYDDWGLGRDYDLFAFLTENIIRGHCKHYLEYDGFNTLPDDLSPETAALIKERDYYHTHSFVTLAELLAFKWNMPWPHTDYFEDEMETCPHCQSEYVVKDNKIWRYSDRFSDLVNVIEQMKEMGMPEDVRAVFAFDS